jgi:hypothetical protein
VINFEIKEDVLKKNYRNVCGADIDLFFPGCGIRQHMEYSTQKNKNMLLLSGVIFLIENALK